MKKFFDYLFGGVFHYILLVFLVNLFANKHLLSTGLLHSPAPKFDRHSVVKPLVYNAKENKRIRIATTPREDGTHEEELTVTLEVDGKKYILDLQLNRNLIPINHTVLYHEDGRLVKNTPIQELCHYLGRVRDMKNSRVALSTCNGLNGIFYDGNSTRVIHTQAVHGGNLESEHVLYEHKHLSGNADMPYEYEYLVNNDLDIAEEHHDEDRETKFSEMLRYKRSKSEETIRDAYRSNKRSRYIEMMMVVDQSLYEKLGEAVYQRCKDITNTVNMLYTPLNIFVNLVKVVIWKQSDAIKLSANMTITITRFNKYLRENFVNEVYDFAQLITTQNFLREVLGEAIVGGVCTSNHSGAVATDDAGEVSAVAFTVAHEMGHSIGIDHDTNNCECPDAACIMSRTTSSPIPVHWSSCSLQYLVMSFHRGLDYCLKNKPISRFEPSCDNGIVEQGEQCDCGLSKSESVGACGACCDTHKCRWRDNATCAAGQCCDLKTCRPSTAGTICRTADHECDLPEYCTGQSEFCPDDIFKMDTEVCNHGKAFCYHGSCRSRSEQCRQLWGPSGTSGPDQCYQMNTNGSRFGNCGFVSSWRHVACAAGDVYCGLLHCLALQTAPESPGIAWRQQTYLTSNYEQHVCYIRLMTARDYTVDPGLVHDGTACGDGKMCIKQKCIAVQSVRVVPRGPGPDCSGRGVRNSLGHCHCKVGFGPPNCEESGPGGSEDSGPASQPSEYNIIIYVILVVIIVVILLTSFLRIFDISLCKRCKYDYKNPKTDTSSTGHLNSAVKKFNVPKKATTASNVSAAGKACVSDANVNTNKYSFQNVNVNKYTSVARNTNGKSNVVLNKHNIENLNVNKYTNVARNTNGERDVVPSKNNIDHANVNKYGKVYVTPNTDGGVNALVNMYSKMDVAANESGNVNVNKHSNVAAIKYKNNISKNSACMRNVTPNEYGGDNVSAN